MTFIGGLIVGCMASIPPGPTAILCIQRNLSRGIRCGVVTGLGIAFCETVYASLAFFSLALVTGFIEDNMLLIKGVAGVFISIFGINIFLKKIAAQVRRNRAEGDSASWKDFASGFLLCAANPTYILVHVGLIATVKSMGLYDTSEGALSNASMIIGIFAGSFGWWFLVSSLMQLVRNRFRPRHMFWINRISGIVITLIGLSLLISMISDLNFNIDDIFGSK